MRATSNELFAHLPWRFFDACLERLLACLALDNFAQATLGQSCCWTQDRIQCTTGNAYSQVGVAGFFHVVNNCRRLLLWRQ